MRLVFVDLETGGLDENRHDIIQIGAIAVDENLHEIESFERKLLFNPSRAEQQALEKNNFNPEIWLREAVHPQQACQDFAKFLAKYADVLMASSRTGNIYKVAQLAAHYAEFDSRFLQVFFATLGVFFPARFQILCTYQRALWYFWERPGVVAPKKFGLADLCRWFDIESQTPHDALSDVRSAIRLYKTLLTVT